MANIFKEDATLKVFFYTFTSGAYGGRAARMVGFANCRGAEGHVFICNSSSVRSDFPGGEIAVILSPGQENSVKRILHRTFLY